MSFKIHDTPSPVYCKIACQHNLNLFLLCDFIDLDLSNNVSEIRSILQDHVNIVTKFVLIKALVAAAVH